jgi:hypothetical protein
VLLAGSARAMAEDVMTKLRAEDRHYEGEKSADEEQE